MLRPLARQGIKREIYSRSPDWWARYTWPMVFGIALWSAIGAENVFNRWTRPVENLNSENGSDAKTNPTKVERELRPLKERAIVSFGIVGFGTGLGVVFLSGRGRIVRRMYGIFHQPVRSSKAASKQSLELRQIIVETFGTTQLLGKERAFLTEQCELELCRKDTELRLKVRGDSSYWLGLDDALINGKPVLSVLVARDNLLEVLKNKDTSKWKTGPIVKATS